MTDLITNPMTEFPDLSVDLKAAEVRALVHDGEARHAIEAELVTLFPVSLIWAHKGLLALYGVAALLGGVIGHSAR